MAVDKARLAPDTMKYLCEEYLKNNYIDPEISERLGVKRGLRNPDGTGVLAGLTNVCDVVGYDKTADGRVVPIPGKLIYRGINVEKIVEEAYQKDRFMFEEVIWLLLFGTLPTAAELEEFCGILESHRALPDGFADDMIMKAPSPNIMNKLARGVLAMYSYDENPEDLSLENLLDQSISLIAGLPTIMVNAWQIKRRIYDHQSMFFHMPTPGQSTAEHILATYRADQKFTHEEAKLLDLCLVLHADHGGGNNSAFTCRVLSSSGTDTYSAIAAAMASLKGPRHGGANNKVMAMMDDIKENVRDWNDDDCVADYLTRMLNKEAFDRSGLIYGLGHAVYTKTDPRCEVFRNYVTHLAEEKGRQAELALYGNVERIGKKLLMERQHKSVLSTNIDFYSGFVYEMLGLPMELYTPLFAVARIAGWSAHRMEELSVGGKLIRPRYECVEEHRSYTPMENR